MSNAMSEHPKLPDIVERLRKCGHAPSLLYHEAADEIERLRAINAELHASLRMMEEAKERIEAINADLLAALEILAGNDLNETNCASVEVAAKRVRNIARAALAGAKP